MLVQFGCRRLACTALQTKLADFPTGWDSSAWACAVCRCVDSLSRRGGPALITYLEYLQGPGGGGSIAPSKACVNATCTPAQCSTAYFYRFLQRQQYTVRIEICHGKGKDRARPRPSQESRERSSQNGTFLFNSEMFWVFLSLALR